MYSTVRRLFDSRTSGDIRFQERFFDDWRLLMFFAAQTFVAPYAYLGFHGEVFLAYLQDVKTNNILLLYSRIFTAGVFATLTVLCGMGTPKFPRFRRWLRAHYQNLFFSAGLFYYFSELLFTSFLEREVAWQEIDKCDQKHTEYLCPNACWSHVSVMVRIGQFYSINMFFGMSFKQTLFLNGVYWVALICTFIPLSAAAWTPIALDRRIIFGATQCVIHNIMSLWLRYDRERKTKDGFNKAWTVQEQQQLPKAVLSTIMPERFLDWEEVSPYTGDPEYPLVLEKFPFTTVMFCSFNKTDLLHIGSADTFLQLVAKCYATFDRIVHDSGLAKVEHVGEDYVVASPILLFGPHARTASDGLRVQETAIMVQTAIELVHSGNKVFDSETGHGLRFKAGLHSGPIIGAIAGKNRRFYRLFGDTMNVAARMCHHAPVGSVRISEATEQAMQGFPAIDLDAAEQTIQVKGKGQMKTFVIGSSVFPAWLTPERTGFESWCTQALACSSSTSVGMIHSSSAEGMIHSSSAEGMIHSSSAAVRSSSTGEGPAARASSTGDEVMRRASSMIHFASTNSLSSVCYNSMSLVRERYSEHRPSKHVSWNKCLDHSYSEVHPIKGTFCDQDLEERYTEDERRTVTMKSSKEHLVFMACVHTAFFTALYSEDDHSSPFHIFGIGAIGLLLVAIHIGLWCWVNVCGVKRCEVALHLSAFASLLGMLSVVSTCRSPFAMMGIASMGFREAHERPLVTGAYTGAAILGALVSMELTLDSFIIRLIFARLCPIIVLSQQICMNRFLYCRALRVNWTLKCKLDELTAELDAIFKDLIPRTQAQKFVFDRFAQTDTIRRSDFLSHREAVERFYFKDSSTQAAILSSDLVGFTPLCSSLTPQSIVFLLHDLWCTTDKAVEKCVQVSKDSKANNCKDESDPLLEPFKMDTIGDAYIIVSMLPSDVQAGALATVVVQNLVLASEIMSSIYSYSMEIAPNKLMVPPGSVKMRMGFAIGSVVAGVLGYLQPRYHVYGDALALSAKLESQSDPHCVRICETSLKTLSSSRCPKSAIMCLIDEVGSPYPSVATYVDQYKAVHAIQHQSTS